MKPLGSRVVIQVTTEEMTRSGLYIPETTKEKPQVGVVLMVGPGDRHPESGYLFPCTVSPGEKVLFQKYSGTDYTLDDREVLIINERDILAVLE